jgi:molybdopterin-biosynthesis enzyme MoeA-like protein
MLTALPAWGATHDDHTIWAMVAYLQKQPRMSAAEYQSLTADAAGMEEHEAAPASAASVPAPAATAAAPVPASSMH